MAGQRLPIEELHKDLVFKADDRRVSFQLARVFYVALALFVLITATLVIIPITQVPQSKSFQAARSFLASNRSLKSHLGRPLKVEEAPKSFLRDGSMWHYLIVVSGPQHSDTVMVTVEQRGEEIKVLEARFQQWNLVTGDTLLKYSKKPL